jgi:hypothetical protein
MRGKHARQIRTGLNARCLPYVRGGDPMRGYFSVLDLGLMRSFRLAYQADRSPLAVLAFQRTRPWTASRIEETRVPRLSKADEFRARRVAVPS